MGKKRIIKKGADEGAVADGSVEEKGEQKVSSKKILAGCVYVYCSYNNTVMSLSDERGNVLAQISAGSMGFKGTKKSTPFAASKVADALAQIARNKGMERVAVLIKGVGSGRDSALRALGSKGFDVVSIEDVTPVPHNGPRPRKVRRV